MTATTNEFTPETSFFVNEEGNKIKNQWHLTYMNLTPHDIILRQGEKDFVFKKSGKVARVSFRQKGIVLHSRGIGIPLNRTDLHQGDVIGLPPNNLKVDIVIVSMATLAHIKPATRQWLPVAPDTNNGVIRNEGGHIVAVTMWTTATNLLCPKCYGAGQISYQCLQCGENYCVCGMQDGVEVLDCATCNGSGWFNKG